MPFTSGILVAAGPSHRFGSPKLLRPYRGEPLILASVRAFVGAGLDEVIVVLGAHAAELRAALAAEPARSVVNHAWEDGMFSSVRAGLLAVDPRTERVAISPADLPLLTPAVVLRVIEGSREADPDTVTVPSATGRRGHPVILPANVFNTVAAWPVRGRLDQLFDGRFRIRHLDGFGPEVLRDVDTPADLKAVEEGQG